LVLNYWPFFCIRFINKEGRSDQEKTLPIF
jgi:hypothetical protein